jgi:hypothetical protein
VSLFFFGVPECKRFFSPFDTRVLRSDIKILAQARTSAVAWLSHSRWSRGNHSSLREGKTKLAAGGVHHEEDAFSDSHTDCLALFVL